MTIEQSSHNPPVHGREGTSGRFWTFEAVEERLVEAMLLWRRAPDRERGWMAQRAYWPDFRRHSWFGDYPDSEGEPRPLPLSRAEVAEMNEASELLRFVAPEDRRLVILAVMALASGAKRVPWMRLRKPMGVTLGADGLRKRYGRAITDICAALNGTARRAI